MGRGKCETRELVEVHVVVKELGIQLIYLQPSARRPICTYYELPRRIKTKQIFLFFYNHHLIRHTQPDP
jgi:hypothetical protein